MLKVECFEISCNCYFVTDDSAEGSLVVDPGGSCAKLEKRIDDYGADKLKYILITHGHYDHIGNAASLKRKYPSADIVIGEKEKDFTSNKMLNLSMFSGEPVEKFEADLLVKEGTSLNFGVDKIEVIETPGHTRGGVCYRIGDVLFTGDTLFRLSMGRTDFPTGNEEELKESLKKLAELDGNFDVYCGHGEKTALEYERKYNTYMRKSLL